MGESVPDQFTGPAGALVVMHAYISGNQSGAEKDNRLLFREQWILLFSKSKMAAWNIRPIRSRIKNSRWRHPRKSAMLENSPPASTEDLGSVSWIFMVTQITPGSRKKCHATSNSILTVSCGPKQQRSVRQVAMMTTEWLGSNCRLERVVQSIMGRWPLREPIRMN